MTTKHTHRLPILLSIASEETEIDVDVQYTVTRGRPPTPPSYSHGGLPAEPAEIEVIGSHVMSVAGKSYVDVAPLWLIDLIANSEAAYQTLGDAADWGKPMRDPDYAREDAAP